MAANTFTLFCLINGELASSAFPVKISSEETIGRLKDAIKAKQAPAFDSITANDLVLWRATIPANENTGDKNIIALDGLDDKTKLCNPRICLSKLFPTSPDENTYILVERPKATSTPHTLQLEAKVAEMLMDIATELFDLAVRIGKTLPWNGSRSEKMTLLAAATTSERDIRKLDSGPEMNVTNMSAMSQDDTDKIVEHLGVSGENQLEDAKELLSNFNDALRLSHYGKRSSEKEFVSTRFKLLKSCDWKGAFDLSEQHSAQLAKAASKIHLNIIISSESSSGRHSVLIYFLGSETKSMTDNWQLLSTVLNTVGPVYKEIPGLIEIFEQIVRNGHTIDLVSGHSLGAGIAQCVAAGIRTLKLIMIDPQLLNDAQAGLICKDSQDSWLDRPRGIAITVDSAEIPRGGLMTRMVKHGFKYPGILWLKMQLLPSDGDGFVPGKGFVTELPKHGKFGYHGSKPDMLLFCNAIDRFVHSGSRDDSQ